MIDRTISPLTITKQCSRCKQDKPATPEYYHRDKSRSDGFCYCCKSCEQQRKGIAPKPEPSDGYRFCTRCGQEKPATHDYFYRDSRTSLGFSSKCIACAKKYCVIYRSRNRESAALRSKLWRRENQEWAKRSNAEYRKRRPDIVRAMAKKWRERNPEKVRERGKHQARLRRARQAKAEGSYTREEILAQYKRQKGRCYYCKQKVGSNYHIDHVVPLTRGGANDIDNLVIACPHCNQSKNNKLPHEWPQGQRLL